MIYLASPYSHISPTMMDLRYRIAEAYTAKCIGEGYAIYSPIVHCHNLAINYVLPTDFKFWRTYNEALLRQSLALWVLELPGWKESAGVLGETQFAHHNGIPVYQKDLSWLASYAPTLSSILSETYAAKTTETGFTTDSIVA